MRNGELIVRGYKPFLRACDRAGRDVRREVHSIFREVGEIVRVDAARRFASVSPVSAAGYRVRVRQRGVSVEQSLRKTTGRNPEYGGRQMRHALLPALMSKQREIDAEFEHAIALVADVFEYGSY